MPDHINAILAQWQHAVTLKPALAAQTNAVHTFLARRNPHGHFAAWQQTIAVLPEPAKRRIDLQNPAVSAEGEADRAAIEAGLRALAPWRKGPFSLYGVRIDSEWRSDRKYARLLATGIDIRGKHILDVGCGNGYFLYRLLGEGGNMALGLDPSWHYFAQYLALEKLLGKTRSAYLPLTLDDIAPAAFDLTLSMGVLYHRRDPLQHLAQLRNTLRDGGKLILETLIIDGDAQTVLVPQDRYAGMRNVWFLPSIAALERWLQRLDFHLVHRGEAVATDSEEQRATTWMEHHSLADFMNADFSATIENLPPPRRVILIAEKSRQHCP